MWKTTQNVYGQKQSERMKQRSSFKLYITCYSDKSKNMNEEQEEIDTKKSPCFRHTKCTHTKYAQTQKQTWT